jgi:lipopolysaccharide biosynthesis regulator YciM
MNIRTFISIVLGFVVVSALALAVLQNLELLNTPFHISGDTKLPVYGVLVLVFFTGLSLALITSFLQDSHSVLEKMRGWWGARTRRAQDDRYRRGIEAMLGGHDERALEIFSEILARRPDYFEALLLSGDALRNVKRFDQAIDRHRRAHRLEPQDLRPLYALADDYEESEQYDKARLALGKIIELEPKKSLSALRRLRKLQMKESDWEGALRTQARIETLIERTPYKMEAEKRYGTGLRYQIGADLVARGKPKEAVQHLRKVLKADPQFVPAVLKLGEALRESEPQAALDTWRQGFQETHAPIFLTALQNHFLDREEPQAAIDTFRALIAESGTKDVMPRFFLGMLFLRLEMIDDAYREFDRLQGRVDHSPAMHYYLGKTLSRRNDFEGAAAEFERALNQMDLPQHQYQCGVCDARFRKWRDRCKSCGEWNTLRMDLREARSLEEMGLASTPVYSA